MRYVEPEYWAKSFTCPHCEAITGQVWHGPMFTKNTRGDVGYALSICQAGDCRRFALWVGKLVESIDTNTGGTRRDIGDTAIVWPPVRTGPEPDPALKGEVLEDFQEARAVTALSPRSSAALLRLALQKLLKQVGQPGKNINDDIAALVKGGLRVDVQKASDIVRLTGNDAVHPGDIDAGDPGTVMPLFDLINLIADDLITRPKRLDAMWETIPEEKRNWVEKRDEPPSD